MQRNSFHELRIGDHIYGHHTAKPPDEVALFFSHTAPENIISPLGKRNWKKINELATAAITVQLEGK